MTDAAHPPRLVCRCRGVASPRIVAAVRSLGLRNVADVAKATKAGSGCGSCHPEIEEILADAAGEPVSAALRLENRLVGQSEACIRIEATLDSRVRPALAARGIAVERFDLDGLVVRIVFAGDGDDDALAVVREELQRFVCRDFDVVTGGA